LVGNSIQQLELFSASGSSERGQRAGSLKTSSGRNQNVLDKRSVIAGRQREGLAG
jgi:hypothetical protein